MAQWKSTDTANASPLWGPSLVQKTNNVTNQTALFNNTTADAFIPGQTVGVFAVSANEAAGDAAHSGWVKRTVGSGGRAGRVQTEVLATLRTVGGDSENVVFKDVKLTIDSQPQNASTTGGAATTFGVLASSKPAGTITYAWAANTGAGFSALTNGGVYSNTTTSTLSISSTTGLNGVQYRVTVSATGANNVVSKPGVLTVA